MELRRYLDILRRRKWLIVEAIILVGLVAGIASSIRTPVYSAKAKVLLRPGDPAEQINPVNTPQQQVDADRYGSAQADIMRSAAVADEAAKSVPQASAGEIQSKLSVSRNSTSDVVVVGASDIDPVRARDIANAVANAYILNRKNYAVQGLKSASDDVQRRLGDLQARIAALDTQIGAGDPAGSSTP